MFDSMLCFIKEYQTIVAVLLAYLLFQLHQLRYAKLTNLSAIVQVERGLGNIDSNDSFRFHGIMDSEITAANLSKEELAYLVANFTAGRIYDVGKYPMWFGTYSEDNYRYKMLARKETRDAWPLIVRMMTRDSYIRKLERTMKRIERKMNQPLTQKKKFLDIFKLYQIFGAFMGVLAVISFLTPNTLTPEQKSWIAAAWLVIPPIYFFIEIHLVRRNHPDDLENCKLSQESASKIWAGVAAALSIIYFGKP